MFIGMVLRLVVNGLDLFYSQPRVGCVSSVTESTEA